MAEHIVIVCGYGCHLVPELRGYLDLGIRYCNEHRPDCLIFSGGQTQKKTAPGQSEAETMWGYVSKSLIYQPESLHLDKHSYTTADNIERAAAMIHCLEPLRPETKLTVFCEATRALKVDLLVRHFIGRRANIETSSWELQSPLKEVAATLYVVAGVAFPPLATFFRNQRIKRAEFI